MLGVIRAKMLVEIENITLYNNFRRMSVVERRKTRGRGRLPLAVFRWQDNALVHVTFFLAKCRGTHS